MPDDTDLKTMADALANNARIGGSRMISYRGMSVLVPARDIEKAVAGLQEGNRHQTMASIRRSIKRLFPAVRDGKASQKEAMDCAQDIAIWFANEIIEGRETLAMN